MQHRWEALVKNITLDGVTNMRITTRLWIAAKINNIYVFFII